MATYLSLDEVLRIYELLIDAFGGAAGVRDMGLIESALIRPQTGYYADLIEEAAALWESLAMSHGFVDGNKRVAYASVELFLQLNGADIIADNDEIERFIYAHLEYAHLEAGTFRKDAVEAWLNAHTASCGA